MRFLKNKTLFTLAAVLALCGIAANSLYAQDRPVKVACIGNSITYGSGLENPERDSYPMQLQGMLGEGYQVGKFGKPGATLMRHGHRPYNEQEEYQQALEFVPDVAVIHLGVNDTDPRNWPNYSYEFVPDYLGLIDTLRAINPNVRIIIANLTPIKATHRRFKSGTRDWRLDIRDAITNVAKAANVELIDFDPVLRDRQDLLPDGVHPNYEGYNALAKEVFSAITGDYGGLQMAEVYAPHMVMQRDRYLKIQGKADAHMPITLTIDGRTYRTLSDNRGDWAVTIAPLSTGKTYTMTVTDGKKTLKYDDIVAGEVWLASGQSNMEFTLNRIIDGQEEIAAANDPDIRFFDLKPIELTNAYRWDSLNIEKVNRLKYFKPATWVKATPESAKNWSAIAYLFAKELRDSLNVPVGIICNALGGSPTESWIDINTLEMDNPESLLNWRTNDYGQDWVQRRAKENTEGYPESTRHPYEPSYLFSSAIRPLAQYPIAGVIWYQGESNAHNTEVHEKLFRMLVDSWRGYFDNPNLPFNFVQLSSINRPSWPMFRDSQRRLAQEIPHTGMAVSSDWGDSLDVHPRNKKPIANRLARIALHDSYGYDGIEYSGPSPVQVVREDDAIIVTMDHADGLHASDGGNIRTFEIAEIEGVYYPATVEINGNQIKLRNMEVKNPRLVRYGWQPFTRANLVNSEGLPASTFKAEVENPYIEAPEQGIEAGVSACYGGRVGNTLIMAGGCNFPGDPFAPGATKKFYKGIYAANPTDVIWHKIGELPEAAAYGASVTMPEGIVLIGGTTANTGLDKVMLLTLKDGKTVLTDLPTFPGTIDNTSACAIGEKVYVAGGSYNGAPSRDLFVLDMANLQAGWKQLPQMPGNARVQPVMAAGKDAKGNDCLYLWGGFAGKTAKSPATLDVEGLCYNPQTKKWTKLPAPVDANGETLSLGGGVATTLTDGRIATAGGVNKDIFLSALQNQAPDYLEHPIEWYRFNQVINVFDPATGVWTVATVTPDAARAGATLIAGPDNDFYLIGGELKPRVRTSITEHVAL